MTPSRVCGAGACLTVTAILAASPVAAAVVLEGDGSVFQQASSQVSSDGAHDFGSKSDSWSGAAHDLHAAASASAFDGVNGAAANTRIAAHWDSATKGTIDLTGHGWEVLGDGADADVTVGLNDPASGQDDWAYSFTVLRDSAMVLASEFIGGGTNNLGLGQWDLTFSQDNGPATVLPLLSKIDVGEDTGFESFLSFRAGHTYRVALRSHEGADVSPVSPLTAAETAHFTWQIAAEPAVPEPSTWALAIPGFGLAGAALRRRRPTRALA